MTLQVALGCALLLACGQIVETAAPEVFTHVEPAPDPPKRPPPAPKEEVFPETVPLRTIDLGEVQEGVAIEFEIPHGTLGFNVVAQGVGMVGVASLRSPTGEWVTRDHRPVGGTYPSSASDTGIAAASVPQNLLASARPPAPGRWEAVFTGSSPLRASVRAQVAPGGAYTGGILDVRVFVPHGLRMRGPNALHQVTPEEAPSDEAMQARLDAFFAGLDALVGVRRGKVTYHGIDERFLTIASLEDASQLYAQGALLGDAQALDIMFVKALELSPGHPLMGRAAAIPGPATRAGTPQSGIAIAVINESTPETDALVMLHEAGHFFGLNHTSEVGTNSFDPIDDTPECKGMDIGALASCPDANNLMFPSANWSGINVSPGQRSVIQGSPIYKLLRKPAAAPVAAYKIRDGRFERHALFGRREVEMTRVERILLSSMCGASPLQGDVLAAALGAASRAELESIASRVEAAEPVRTLARTALSRLR